SLELKVLFDTGKAVLKPEFRPEAERAAAFIRSHPDSDAEIDGHTDNVGKPEMNEKLSQSRADAVRNYLIQEFGIQPEHIAAKGYGETQPVASNAPPEGRAANRRVVVVLRGTQKPTPPVSSLPSGHMTEETPEAH